MMLDDRELGYIADILADKLDARLQGIAPRLMDSKAAAVYLGRSQSAVEQMMKKGKVPVTRVDGKPQIDRIELDKLIKACTA